MARAALTMEKRGAAGSFVIVILLELFSALPPNAISVAVLECQDMCDT